MSDNKGLQDSVDLKGSRKREYTTPKLSNQGRLGQLVLGVGSGEVDGGSQQLDGG